MRAGSLRHLVSLQRYTESRSSDGGVTKTYSTYATVWAGFRTLSGGERTSAQQVGATLTHEVTIRYRSGVHVDHRILWGSRYFDIKDIRDVDERRKEIRMRVVEVMTAGPVSSPSPSTSGSASPSNSASA